MEEPFKFDEDTGEYYDEEFDDFSTFDDSYLRDDDYSWLDWEE